jgi:hypothetical protein
MTKQFLMGCAASFAALSCLGVSALAQEPVRKPATTTRIQTETVTVTRAAAFPSQITRKPGPFFLELRTPAPDSELNLVLVPAVQLLDLSKLRSVLDLPALRRRRRSAGLVDLPPGVYYLRLQASSKTICTIRIGE